MQVVHSEVARRIAVARLYRELECLDLTERGEVDPLPVVDHFALLIAIVDEWYLDLVAIVSRDGHDKEATLLKGGTTEVLVALGSKALDPGRIRQIDTLELHLTVATRHNRDDGIVRAPLRIIARTISHDILLGLTFQLLTTTDDIVVLLRRKVARVGRVGTSC